MQKLVITGGIPLEGTVVLHGAKNSVLPILAASLLCHGGNSSGELSQTDRCICRLPDFNEPWLSLLHAGTYRCDFSGRDVL